MTKPGSIARGLALQTEPQGASRGWPSEGQHHAQRDYQEELRLLCKRHGIEIDERYVWD